MIFYKEKENMKKVMKMFVGLIAVVLFTACNNGADGEVNNIPTANAGIDVLVEVNTPVTVTGTASDSDGTIVDVEWKEGTTVLSTTLSFDYIPTTVGTHILTLTVMDDEGATASDEVNIKATPTPNQSPTANAGVDKTVTVNESVNINGTANDPDGMIVDVDWSENGNTIATTLSFSYTPTTTGEHNLTLTVMDDDGATASDSMIVTANAAPVNQPPEWTQASYDTGLTITDANDDPKVILDLASRCSDPEGDTITYTVESVHSSGAPLDEPKIKNSLYVENGVLKIHNLMTNDPDFDGTITVTVKASATGGSSNTDILFVFHNTQ